MKWQGQLLDLLMLLRNGYCILGFVSVIKQRYEFLLYTHPPSNPKEVISSIFFTSMAINYIYKVLMFLVEL